MNRSDFACFYVLLTVIEFTLALLMLQILIKVGAN